MNCLNVTIFTVEMQSPPFHNCITIARLAIHNLQSHMIIFWGYILLCEEHYQNFGHQYIINSMCHFHWLLCCTWNEIIRTGFFALHSPLNIAKILFPSFESMQKFFYLVFSLSLQTFQSKLCRPQLDFLMISHHGPLFVSLSDGNYAKHEICFQMQGGMISLVVHFPLTLPHKKTQANENLSTSGLLFHLGQCFISIMPDSMVSK